MEAEPQKPASPKRKRRWYQFSLRTLFVVVTLLAVICGWLATKIEQKRHERIAAAAIQKLGGEVWYRSQSDEGGSPTAQPPGPACLRWFLGDDFFDQVDSMAIHKTANDGVLVNLKHLPLLNTLDLSGSKVTDEGLEKIKELSQLEILILSKTEVGDAGLVKIKDLTSLRFLFLASTKITGNGLVSLKALIHLRTLSLWRTAVTDVGLEDLKRLEELQSLDLSETNVTDQGLAHLKGLPKLRYLHLQQTKTTNAAVTDLRRSLPNCHIYQNSPANDETTGVADP